MIMAMMLSLAACSGSNESEDTAENEVNVSDTQDPGAEEEEKDAETETDSDKEENKEQQEDIKEEVKDEGQQEPSVPAASVAQTLAADFKACAGNSSAQAIADRLLQNELIQFMGGTAAVQPGLLTGFGNAEITGFSEGVMFAPNIGTIPFIGYIFVVEEGTDVSTFMSTLKSNADPSWNVCTQADETVVTNVGSKVFFLMSPKTFEQ